jgi:uncharacterized protein GlcG (DUF336 family)
MTEHQLPVAEPRGSEASVSRRRVLRGVVSGAGVIGAGALLSRPTTAQEATPIPATSPLTTQAISLGQAQAIIAAAITEAEHLGTLMNIAVVDMGGHLKAFARMDGALLGSIDIAIRKARTAALLEAPTGEIGALSQPGGPIYGVELSNEGLITFPGGLPLTSAEGTVIGAVGVSGSTVADDEAVAEAGAAAIQA